MKLYYRPGVCSLASHIALREVGQPFTLDKIDRATGKTEGGVDFATINPKFSVPALEIAPGEVLTEGTAIMQYVADAVGGAGVVPKAGTLARARMQEAMNFIAAELHKSYSPLFKPGLSDAQKAAGFALIDTKLAWIEARLADGRDWLVQEGYSLADSYLFVITRWSKGIGHDLSRFPLLQALRARVALRPAVQAALKAEGLAE